MPPFLLPFVGPLLDKLVGLIPDKAAAAKARTDAELALTQQSDDMVKAFLASDQAQDAINQAAANSKDLFTERARPSALWMCIVALAWQGIIIPIVQCAYVWVGHAAPQLPVFSTDLTQQLLYGLLGLSGFHAYQAVQNTKNS